MNAFGTSFDVSPTQNTAPVLEFRCLYSHDLVRKQKRWQDGRLRFHTFNKRVMVYDDRNNFVGDTHWKGQRFDEGEELKLDRGGVLIEVGECIGKKDQDLTELVDKRVHDREEREAARIANGSPARPHQMTPGAGLHLQLKSLNAIIGTPSGHYGRAMVPAESPFEQKNRGKQEENANERSAKRQRRDETPSKSGYAQSLTGSMLSLNTQRPPSTATIRYAPLKVTVQRSQPGTVDLTETDGEGATKPSRRSPPRVEKRKARRSPPPKSGYASSLTGASLSLAAPSSYVSRVAGHRITSAKVSDVPQEHDHSSSPTDGTSAGVLEIMPAKIARTRSCPSHKTSMSPATANSRLSSPVPAPTKTKSTESTKRKNKTQKAAPVIESRSYPPPERDRGTLPPKIASTSNLTSRVLSDRPMTTLRIKARPKKQMMMLRELPAPRSKTAAPFTAGSSFDLETSGEATRENYHASSPHQRELCNETECDSDTIVQPSLQMMSSSPIIDKGIDHRTIDALLSRRRPSVVEQGSTNHKKILSKVVSPKSLEPILSSPHDAQPRPPLMSSTHPNGNVEPPSVKAVIRQISKSPPRQMEGKSSPKQTPNVLRDLGSADRSIQSATKTSASNAVSPNSTDKELREPEQMNLNPDERPSLPAKVSTPSLPPVISSRMEERRPFDTALPQNLAHDPGPLPLTKALPSLETTRLAQPIPKAKLANPATRGPSIAIAASKTVDQLTLDPKAPQMPSPVITNRPMITIPRGPQTGAASKRGAAADTSTGPWSRESFDLFGTWKPPERTGTGVVSG